MQQETLKLKDLWVPLALALFTTWGIHQLFWGGNERKTADSAIEFFAPVGKSAIRPLLEKLPPLKSVLYRVPEETEVKVEWGVVALSSRTAAISKIVVAKGDGLSLLDAETDGNGGLLLAINEELPTGYSLETTNEDVEKVILLYRLQSQSYDIDKTVTIYKKRPLINVSVSLVSRIEDDIIPTVWLPGISKNALVAGDALSSLVYNSQQLRWSRQEIGSIDFGKGWLAPAMFGFESKYFVSVLWGENEPIQRAYYARVEGGRAAVVEGPVVTDSGEWTVSFYCGPKDLFVLRSVDSRLEDSLDYWWPLSWAIKQTMLLMDWLYQYVPSYGFIILLITALFALLKHLFSPDMGEQRKSSAEVTKKLAYLRKKHKDNPALLAAEQGELIRKHGVPGLGRMMGSLMQIPILVAMNRVVATSYSLYKAPWLWVPDLSATDPYYIIPAIVFFGVLFNMLFVSSTARFPQIMFGVFLACLMTAFTINCSAGLGLYFAAMSWFAVLFIIIGKKLRNVQL